MENGYKTSDRFYTRTSPTPVQRHRGGILLKSCVCSYTFSEGLGEDSCKPIFSTRVTIWRFCQVHETVLGSSLKLQPTKTYFFNLLNWADMTSPNCVMRRRLGRSLKLDNLFVLAEKTKGYERKTLHRCRLISNIFSNLRDGHRKFRIPLDFPLASHSNIRYNLYCALSCRVIYLHPKNLT